MAVFQSLVQIFRCEAFDASSWRPLSRLMLMTPPINHAGAPQNASGKRGVNKEEERDQQRRRRRRERRGRKKQHVR